MPRRQVVAAEVSSAIGRAAARARLRHRRRAESRGAGRAVTDRVAIGSTMPREGRSPVRRRLSRPARLTLGFLAASASVGLLASLYAWLTLDPDIGAPRPAVVLAGVGVAVGTMANLLLRFLRW